jgi:hypothetical protein
MEETLLENDIYISKPAKHTFKHFDHKTDKVEDDLNRKLLQLK